MFRVLLAAFAALALAACQRRRPSIGKVDEARTRSSRCTRGTTTGRKCQKLPPASNTS